MKHRFQKGNQCAKKIDHKRRSENRYILHPQGLRRCYTCNQIQTIKSFSSKGKNVLNSECKTCENKRNILIREESRTNLNLYCRKLCIRLKSRAKKNKVPCTITDEDLIEQWRKQGGKCFYTGEIMSFAVQSAYNYPCINRKIPSLGYIPGNIVWSMWFINKMKSDLTDTQFNEFCRKVLEYLIIYKK